jgi:hypothetical protein
VNATPKGHQPNVQEGSIEVQTAAADVPAVTAACPALQPYGKTVIDVALPESLKAGKAYHLTITTGSHLQQPMVFTAEKVRVPRRSTK